jgi:hypothetical protein
MSCEIKNNANLEMGDLEGHIHGMYDHFDQKYGFQKPPVIVFDSDPSNESNVLGKTAYYDPQSLQVHVFADGRHPKDMLRSIAHELIHHYQNLEGRLDVGGYNGPGYYLENDKLREVEQEAMLEGNATLREYEDKLKLEERDKMSLKEWKNNELNGLLMKKFGILKESKDENGLTDKQKKLPKALQDKIANKKGEVDNTENTKSYKGKKSDSDDDDAPKGGAPAAAEEKEATNESVSSRSEDVANNRRQGREGSKTQPDRLHEEDLDEGQICEECGGKHKLEEEEELDEGGLADRAENAAQAAAGRKEGGRFKRMQESIRRTLKENKKIRLRIRK